MSRLDEHLSRPENLGSERVQSAAGDATPTGVGSHASAQTVETGAGPHAGAQTSADPGLEPLTPRPVERAGRRRRWASAFAIVVVAVAVTLLVVNLLGDSALFFYNADEAVARREELSSKRFRVQGTPVGEPVATFRDDQPVLAFTIGFNDVVVDVVHVGDPPELFQPGVPVVLEGFWRSGSGSHADTEGTRRSGSGSGPDAAGGTAAPAGDGWHFASDRMLVKHDNDYRDSDGYEERVVQADAGGAVP